MVSTSPGAVSPARLQRRAQIVEAARALVGAQVGPEFDAVRAPICAIDVVMVAGSPWLKDGLERDFAKDEAGYRKIGGGANTPQAAYFFRSSANLMHFLKRAGFYVPRGGQPEPAPGMVCFFDWDDRGRFNFAPDRSGVIVEVTKGRVSTAAVACPVSAADRRAGYVVRALEIHRGDAADRALIGYSDLP